MLQCLLYICVITNMNLQLQNVNFLQPTVLIIWFNHYQIYKDAIKDLLTLDCVMSVIICMSLIFTRNFVQESCPADLA